MANHTCDFPTAIRLLEVGTLTEIVDLHNPAAGLDIAAELTLPLPNKRQGRRKYARAGGSYPLGARVPDDGTLIVPVNVFGDTWPDYTTNYEAMYAGLNEHDEFIVETVLSGVTTRWFCDAPVDVVPAPIDSAARILNSVEYELRFLVQLPATVTIGA